MDGLVLAIAAVTFVMALVSLNRVARLETALFKLREEMQRIASTRGAPEAPTAAGVEALTSLPEPASKETPSPDRTPTPESQAANWYQSGAQATAATTAPARPPRGDMEQAIAGRWFVWIGGVAIAIGGLLFVKYAYDKGLISPVLQIVLGMAAGLVLILAGALLRRRSAGTDHVPAALSAAWLAVLFAAIFAAYALYGIIEPATAFMGLAAVGLGALVLSRWQGPFIAVLGLLGSYVTPALIPSADPSAWNFFPYLLVILTASLLTIRGRSWWWLGQLAVLGTLVWSVLWLIGPFEMAETWAVGVSAIVMGLAAVILPRGFAGLRDGGEDVTPAQFLGLAGQAAATVVLVLLVLRTDYVDAGLTLLAIGLGLMVLLAWFSRGLALLAPFAGLVMLAVLGSWQEAAFHAVTLDENGVYSWSNSSGPEAQRFLRWMLGAGAAFTFFGAAGVVLRPAKRAWGALGGGAGFLFVWAAWARADFLLPEQTWAAVASGIALFLLLVTALWGRRQEGDGTGAGLLAAGAAALLAMALDRLLEGVWLTLGLAGLAFVFAILSTPLKPRLMGPITAAIATLATLRLFLARELWFDERNLPWGDHWVLYGYGVPAILFILASRILRQTDHPRSAAALEGMSLGLLITLISLELRVLITGGITYEDPRFLEMAAHILAWAGAAYGLMHGQRLLFFSRLALGCPHPAAGLGAGCRHAQPVLAQPGGHG